MVGETPKGKSIFRAWTGKESKLITILRILTTAFAIAGLCGYAHGLFLTVCGLGILNIAYGVEACRSKNRANAIASLLTGVGILVFAAVHFCGGV